MSGGFMKESAEHFNYTWTKTDTRFFKLVLFNKHLVIMVIIC